MHASTVSLWLAKLVCHSKPATCCLAGKADAVEAADGELGEADDGDDGEWEVAASSHNAARRKKRKEVRRAVWAAAAAQRAAQADETGQNVHHLEGTADAGDSEDWETDGTAK